MAETAAGLAKRYGLRPHPEGGFFRETYRSRARAGGRNLCTAIYFLLPRGAKSRLHRIKSDEIWHFHLGGPLTVVQIAPSGRLERIVLGRGYALQHVVPAGYWFGAYPNPRSPFSLVGCTVSPGFDFADLELGDRKKLTARFPRAKAAIRRLTD